MLRLWLVQHSGDKAIRFRLLGPGDEDALLAYLDGLSSATRRRFEPHPFDSETVTQVCAGRWRRCRAYGGFDAAGRCVCYAIVAPGLIDFDAARYAGYEVALDAERDVTLAPSVADVWQSQGLGSAFMAYLLEVFAEQGARRVALWAGVQADNEIAVAYYHKFGFRELGRFEHNGQNIDMVRELCG